jgi:DNA-binding transcriptional MerR regulator
MPDNGNTAAGHTGLTQGKEMTFTVKQVAAMSGVSVRALHFYDETGLLKPANVGANGYRFYEEPQLLMLQQILFYRELGFELKHIKKILRQAEFEKIAALQSHRELLEEKVARMRSLLETIDKTVKHLTGTEKMESEEMFVGFSVAAGQDRFDERLRPGGEPVDCKLSAKDTDGAMCVFEVTAGWPRHLHHEQDEWLYIIAGQVEFEVGEKRFRAGSGESVFIPRKVAHVWSPAGGEPARIINVYQPAGKVEEFFRQIGSFHALPTREQVISNSFSDEQVTAMRQMFETFGMELLGPPLVIE